MVVAPYPPPRFISTVEARKTSILDASVKRFCRDLVRTKRPPAQICTFYFAVDKLLSGTTSVGQLSNAVAECLALAHRNTNTRVPKKRTRHRNRQEDETEPYMRFPTAFITEGLGSCVVKNLLFDSGSQKTQIVKTTCSVLFLDAPPNERELSADEWRKYLDGLRVDFDVHDPLSNNSSMVNLTTEELVAINRTFETSQTSAEPSNFKTRYGNIPTPDFLRFGNFKPSSGKHPNHATTWFKGRLLDITDGSHNIELKGINIYLQRLLEGYWADLVPADLRQFSASAHSLPQSPLQNNTDEAPRRQISHLSDSNHMPVRSQPSSILHPVPRQNPSPKLLIYHSTPRTESVQRPSKNTKTVLPVSSDNTGSPRRSITSTMSIVPEPTAHDSVAEPPTSPTDGLTSCLSLAQKEYHSTRFISAKDAYLASKRLLEYQKGPGVEFLRIVIDKRLAIISLELGYYDKAEEEFRRLLEEIRRSDQIPASSQANLWLQIMKWKAVTLLRQGCYQQAANELRHLLERTNDRWIDDVEKWKLYRIEVQKSLTLAVAHVGPYSLVRKQIETVKKEIESYISDTGCIEDSVDMMDVGRCSPSISDGGFIDHLMDQHDDLKSTAATAYALWGSDHEALKMSAEALQGRQERGGPGHIRTLECMALDALLLAKGHRDQLLEAKRRSDTALRHLKAQSKFFQLDAANPYLLETIWKSIEIITLLGDLLTARLMAIHMNDSTEQAFGQQHPLALKSHLVLSQVQLQFGETHDAVMRLQQVYLTSMSIYHEVNFLTLAYSSTYARALCEAGAVQEAERIAVWTLGKQRDAVSPLESSETVEFEKEEDEQLSPDHALILWTLEAMSHATKGSRAHPSLLFTLETIALNEVRKEKPLWHLAERILTCCWAQKWEDPDFGPTHPSTLDSEFKLAMSLPIGVEDEEHYVKKETHLRNVYLGRMRRLGDRHAETLIAKRELIAHLVLLASWKDLPELGDGQVSFQDLINTSATVNDTSSDNGRPFDKEVWGFIGNVSTEIYNSHQKGLGYYHSETLKSLFWLFKLEVITGLDPKEWRYMERVLSCLRDPDVLEQRPFESVIMRLDVVIIMLRSNLFVLALATLHQIQSDIAESCICQHSIYNDTIERLQRITQNYVSRATENKLKMNDAA